MTTHHIRFFLLLGCAASLFQFSCGKKEACQFPVRDAAFNFRFVDKYGVNQIAVWGAPYQSDSTYFTKLDGTLPRQLEMLADGNISFVIQEDDYEAADTQATRIFLLYLPDFQAHPRADIDTITFKYKFEGACFDQLAVYYNDSLYHDGRYTDFMLFVKN